MTFSVQYAMSDKDIAALGDNALPFKDCKDQLQDGKKYMVYVAVEDKWPGSAWPPLLCTFRATPTLSVGRKVGEFTVYENVPVECKKAGVFEHPQGGIYTAPDDRMFVWEPES